MSRRNVKRRSIAQRAVQQSIEIIDLTLDSPIRNNDKNAELNEPSTFGELLCCCCEALIDVRFHISMKKCSHKRCILCIIQIIKDSPTVRVNCPLCEEVFDDQEIRALLTTDEYSIHERKDSLYKDLLDLEEQSGYISSLEVFTCDICLLGIEVGDGMMLRNCLHQFCIDCVRGSINNSTEATVKCPADLCDNTIEDREIRALVTQAEFDKYSLRMLKIVESQSSNSFHCKSPNCDGWAFVEDAVSFLRCPICSSINCLSCQAIHTGLNCLQYQNEKLWHGMSDDERTNHEIEKIIEGNQGMRCPTCKIIIMKRDGCDWLVCAMCKTEICWATKQSRWGPRGRGDTSGGCKCFVTKKCTPTCRNCH